MTAIPAGILSKAVDVFISIRALLSAIVCANGMAATYKYSASGSPDVMTCSVVYRYLLPVYNLRQSKYEQRSGKRVPYLEKVQKEEVKHASWMDRFFKN